MGDLEEESRQGLEAVPVPSGSVQIEATGGVQIITTGSKMSMRCSRQGCRTGGGMVTVDGMRARYVCPHGHITSSWVLGPAHARWALRHVGHDSASSGHRRVDGVFHIPQTDESARMELSANAWVRQEQRGFQGDPGVLRKLDAAIQELDRPRHVHPEIPQEVTVLGAITITAGDPLASGISGAGTQCIRCPECHAETGFILRGMWGAAPWLTCPNGDTWELPDSAMATQLFKEILIQMDPLGTRPETDEEP